MTESADETNTDAGSADPHGVAVDRLKGLLIGGVLICLTGFVVVLIAHPRSRLEYGDRVHVGSAGWVLVGSAIGSAGVAMVLVGLIGFGIKLGLEASRT